MNKRDWEIAQASSETGFSAVENFFDAHEASARAAIGSAGITLSQLSAEHDAADELARNQARLEEEQNAAKAEQDRLDLAEKINNNLFLSTAIGLLPRMESRHPTYDEGRYIQADDPFTAYNILDSVIWRGNSPFWLIGYRESDSAGILMPLAPSENYRSLVLKDPFRDGKRNHESEVPGNLTPFDNEFSFRRVNKDYIGPDYIELETIPQDMKFALRIAKAYAFTPGKADAKIFKQFASTEIRPESVKYLRQTFDKKTKTFHISTQSPRVAPLSDKSSELYAIPGSHLTGLTNNDIFEEFGVFGRLVSLMRRFDKKTEYSELFELAKDGRLTEAAMKQQGIPALNSQAEVLEFLKEHTWMAVLAPEEAENRRIRSRETHLKIAERKSQPKTPRPPKKSRKAPVSCIISY